jgi:hypothetical protein
VCPKKFIIAAQRSYAKVSILLWLACLLQKKPSFLKVAFQNLEAHPVITLESALNIFDDV